LCNGRRHGEASNHAARTRRGGAQTGGAARDDPETTDSEARLLAAGCPVNQAKSYGDCLTYSAGHYDTWDHWRRDRTLNPSLRPLVRSYEYEEWPRGRIVCDRSRVLFVLYADRKLLTPATIARLKTQFQLPVERTEIQSD
jgi:hypothetical protein